MNTSDTTHMNSRDDLSPLKLSVDGLGSSQPFPSPGSAFVPPPVPGLHEFAIRPSSAGLGRKMSKKDGDDHLPDPRCAATPSNASTAPDVDLATVSATSPNGVDSSTPPIRDSLSPIAQMPPDPSHNPSPDPPLSLQPNPNHRLSTNSVTSLTSSRPAPPSPVVSRRASGLSRASSTARSRPVSGISTMSSRPVSGVPRSRPVSGSLQPATGGTLSRTPSGRRLKDSLSMSAVTTFKEEQGEATPTQATVNDSLATPIATTAGEAVTPTTTTTTESFLTTLITIRDYGFATSDPRFSGHGQNVPRPNRPSYLARRLRPRSSSPSVDSTSTTSSSSDDENLGEDVGMNGWGGFKWGIGRAWGFGRGLGGSSGADAGFPSRGDLDRNFGTEDEGEDDDMDVDEEGDEVYAQFEDDGEGEPLLLPGLYRALYAFEPEGTAEMKLEEDQIVRVVGRGGGVGWAVVVKDGLKDTGVHALVPESYLEPLRPDGDEEDA